MQINNILNMDFYTIRSKFKIFILVVALLIGGVSIYYTNFLVKKLAEREEKLIDLYAKGLKFAADPMNSGNLTFLFQEIIEANNSVPVILTDDKENPISDKNITFPSQATKIQKEKILIEEIKIMKLEHPPIDVEYAPGLKNYIFYRNSDLLTQLIYYPYIQLTIIAIFSIVAYLAFSYSRNSEQNRVWVGLAKETAHQLGTPLSSLMAWVEIFKSDPKYENAEIVTELEKDVSRLEMITARFSNIGSVPVLQNENIYLTIEHTMAYLRNRVSPKIKFTLNTLMDKGVTAKINKPLFDWVIENTCKNAVDAMDGKGSLDLVLSEVNGKIAIDISDTGKGIPKSKLKEVFKPGYTTKKRGWGLGLTLVKRIVENYHKGKIFVFSSEMGKGTTFRVLLNK